MLKDFKAFVLRGNVIDLAVGVAIGAAFGTVVSSFTKNLLTPLLAIPGDRADFSTLDFTISGSEFKYGAVINDLIFFVLTAAVLFFVVVRPVNHMINRRKTEPEPDAPTRPCPECLSEIPAEAKRCAFCTARLSKAA